MKRASAEKKRYEALLRRKSSGTPMPESIDDGRRLVRVYVEGYEDVAFWRGIFDHFPNRYVRFEISVPNREDLPKGKKVLMSMIPSSSEELLLCVDSDFDYLFGDTTPQSAEIHAAQYMFHTYTYATENYLCYAPSLHNVCVKATKNDCHIFDFVRFMADYSRIIYRIFLWYACSAHQGSESVFPLVDFKNTVRLGYLEIEDNGAETLAWLQRNVDRRLRALEERYPRMEAMIDTFGQAMERKGLTPETTYLYMHGHTLMDNVVMVLLNTVCDRLRTMSIEKINSSRKQGLPLKNEMSNYINSLRSIRDVLLDNENYTSCPLYEKLRRDIEVYLAGVISNMKRQGQGGARRRRAPQEQNEKK